MYTKIDPRGNKWTWKYYRKEIREQRKAKERERIKAATGRLRVPVLIRYQRSFGRRSTSTRRADEASSFPLVTWRKRANSHLCAPSGGYKYRISSYSIELCRTFPTRLHSKNIIELLVRTKYYIRFHHLNLFFKHRHASDKNSR